MRLALHVHYPPFSVTSEEALRDSEPLVNQLLIDTQAPREGLGRIYARKMKAILWDVLQDYIV